VRVCTCGFCNVWVCVCVGILMCGCAYVWIFCGCVYVCVLCGCVYVCVLCGCVYVGSFYCVGVLVKRLLVFTVFCIFSLMLICYYHKD